MGKKLKDSENKWVATLMKPNKFRSYFLRKEFVRGRAKYVSDHEKKHLSGGGGKFEFVLVPPKVPVEVVINDNSNES